MQSVNNRYLKAKPELKTLFKDDPVWGGLATYLTDNADHEYELVGLVNSVYYDEVKDSGTVYIIVPDDDKALAELVKFNTFFFPQGDQQSPAPFKLPWSNNGTMVNFKVAAPYGKSAKEFFEAMTDNGSFMKDIEVCVTFKLKPYTQFPDKNTHGVSCKLTCPVELIGMYAEPSQDPDA